MKKTLLCLVGLILLSGCLASKKPQPCYPAYGELPSVTWVAIQCEKESDGGTKIVQVVRGKDGKTTLNPIQLEGYYLILDSGNSTAMKQRLEALNGRVETLTQLLKVLGAVPCPQEEKQR